MSENIANSKTFSNNKLGNRGVYFHKGRYWAHITHNYKTLHLGVFNTLEEAVKARTEKAEELFGEFASHTFVKE